MIPAKTGYSHDFRSRPHLARGAAAGLPRPTWDRPGRVGVRYRSLGGAEAVEEKMLWAGAAMGLSAMQRMIRIVLAAALREILTGCRTGLVLALITMVTSEMIARQSGAGNILFNSLDMGQYDTVYAMIIIIGAMGIGLDAAFEKLRSRLVRWSEPGFDIPLSFA